MEELVEISFLIVAKCAAFNEAIAPIQGQGRVKRLATAGLETQPLIATRPRLGDDMLQQAP